MKVEKIFKFRLYHAVGTYRWRRPQ